MVLFYMKDWLCLTRNSYCNSWIRRHYSRYQKCVERHHFKILLAGLAFLGLCCLGFKSADLEHDLVRLWIYNSSRLHDETTFVQRMSSNHVDQDSIETVIQVSHDNILSPDFLLEHLQLLKLIVNLEIRFDRKVFTLRHFCRQISLPRMHYLSHDIRENIENIMPCEIVTPLNCFWEGSKLLNTNELINLSDDERYLTMKIDWTKFDFQVLLNTFRDSWDRDFFVKLLNDSGVGRGYITKPCIDITDPLCPDKNTKRDKYENVLSKGCFQVAEQLYNYPKAVLVGEHNRALQSMIFIRSAADFFKDTKSRDLDWSEEKSRQAIALWQTAMRDTVIKYNKQRPYLESIVYSNVPFQFKRVERSSFYTFTNNSLPLALQEANDDKTMCTKYLVCSSLVTLLVVIIFLSSDNPVRSHCWLAITGTVLVIMAMVAGLGLSAAVGLKFSALTVQVIPFIMLGLGIEDVLILTSSYSRSMDNSLVEDAVVHPIYQTLHSCASTTILTFLVKVSIVGGASFIPVPLMRSFCGQVLLITIFQSGTIAFLYPCLLYLDYIRQRNNRIDILCCLLKQIPASESPGAEVPYPRYDSPSAQSHLASSQVVFSTEFTTSPDDLVPNNVRQYVEITPTANINPHLSTIARQTTRPQEQKPAHQKRYRCCWKFRYRISKTFMHIMALVPVHITIIILTLAVVVFGLYSAININYGLNIQSIFLRDSNEYNYVKYESSEFRMNNFDILLKEIDYVHLQGLVLHLNDEIKAVKHVQVFGNGKFWLSSFILWLEKLQQDLDHDLRYRLILPNGSWGFNASNNGLLAMTLLVQDRGAINYRRIATARLVQSHRVDHSNFYLYLNVWRSVSADYDTIPCILYPPMKPFNIDYFIPSPQRREPLAIKMSGQNLYDTNPLQFVTCKYFHKGVEEKDDLSFVKTIRTITSKFIDKGVVAIPLGNVFSLSEQYLSLRYHMMIASIISVVGVFLMSLLTMNHLLVTLLICLLLCSSLFSPFYLFSIYHLPLNGTSGVMALWSGGLGIRLSLYVIVSYSEQSLLESSSECGGHLDDQGGSSMSAVPEKQLRMRRAIASSPCASVILGTVLSCAFISMTSVTYIWEHFLLIPLVGLVHSTFNCYCLAPVLCFYLLPKKPISPLIAKQAGMLLPRTTSSLRSHSNLRRKKSRSNIGVLRSESGPKPDPEKLSTIPEESSSVKSSTRSSASKEDVNHSQFSQARVYPQYIEQDVQSILSVQYPSTSSPSAGPEIAVKTSFKYRKPIIPGR